MPSQVRILVVDDHEVLSQGLAALFENTPDLQLVATASCASDAFSILKDTAIDVVLLDLRLPDLTGFEVLRQIQVAHNMVKVLILSSHEGDEAIRRALAAGAKGFVPKRSGGEVIVQAVRTVAQGSNFLSKEALARLAATEMKESLTGRERQVLDLAAQGLSNKDIAARLSCAERTVKYHLNCIFQKLEVTDRTQAVRVGLRRGIIDD